MIFDPLLHCWWTSWRYACSAVMEYRLCNTHKASSVYLCRVALRNTRLHSVVGPKQQNEGLACRGIGRRTNILRDSFEKKSFTHTSLILQKVRNFYRAPTLRDLPALTRQKPQASRKAQTLVNHDLEIYPHFLPGRESSNDQRPRPASIVPACWSRREV